MQQKVEQAANQAIGSYNVAIEIQKKIEAIAGKKLVPFFASLSYLGAVKRAMEATSPIVIAYPTKDYIGLYDKVHKAILENNATSCELSFTEFASINNMLEGKSSHDLSLRMDEYISLLNEVISNAEQWNFHFDQIKKDAEEEVIKEMQMRGAVDKGNKKMEVVN